MYPFDSFLWHRERVAALFGFDYRIEVYTPGHKRVHGYYTLPLYHDGRLIGRVDAKNHRAERRLEVRHVHFEPWVARRGEPPGARWGGFERGAAMAGLADSIASVDPDIVVASNPGCLLHMARGVRERGSGVRVLHLVEVLALAHLSPGEPARVARPVTAAGR